jgi:hypothetical protein
MRLNHPEEADLQQGSIFNCVQVDGYDDCECWGIVLNARCDLAHDKAGVVSFLPIVKFSDWCTRSLVQLAARRARNDLHTSLINHLISRPGVSKHIIDTFPWKEIIEKEFKSSDQKPLLLKLQHFETLESAIALSGAFCSFASSVTSIAKKQCEKVIQELIQQQLADCYFLNEVDVYCRSQHGYVVLLRHIHTLPVNAVKLLCVGLSSEQLSTQPSLSGRLTFSHQPLCMITGVLRSPDIEHLTQQFASLFTRIGLEDQPQETIALHCQMVLG